MLLLSLALGWLAPAAGPGPSGTPDDLARVARFDAPAGHSLARSSSASETAGYAVEAAGRAEISYVLPVGPRTISALEIEPTPASADAWRSARLRLTWEDDNPWTPDAAVDLPVGLAFGRAGGALPSVDSVAIGTLGGAWVNRFPMPYRTRALLRISTDRPIEGRIQVRSTRGVAPDAGYFQGTEIAVGRRGVSTAAAAAASISATGRGQLAGLFSVIEGPAPGGPGRLVVDGKAGGTLSAALSIDARHDLARGAKGRSRGVLLTSEGTAAGRLAAYRWFLSAPIAFHDSFLIEADAGPSAVPQALAVFWYSEKAHR